MTAQETAAVRRLGCLFAQMALAQTSIGRAVISAAAEADRFRFEQERERRLVGTADPGFSKHPKGGRP